MGVVTCQYANRILFKDALCNRAHLLPSYALNHGAMEPWTHACKVGNRIQGINSAN